MFPVYLCVFIFHTMPTFLFDKIIFGPVISRRLGISLGINLLPTGAKVCTFDCIYCECGWTNSRKDTGSGLPTREEVRLRLEEKLTEMRKDNRLPDVITFAGNGEPTMHPDFADIIDDTIRLREEFSPGARIAVLSNASLISREKVFQALLRVDDNIQKLDSAFEDTVRLLDNPPPGYNLEKTVQKLAEFKGKVIIQTMFVRGTLKGLVVDNTTDREVEAWLELIRKIQPEQVMIYTIARDTPVDSLIKVSEDDLDKIAGRLRNAGFRVQVSA